MSNPAALKLVELHPKEKILVALLTAWIVFLPWAFGSMRAWAQVTGLFIAAFTFVVAAMPRKLEGVGETQPLRLLVRSPLFWLGLGLLGYVAVQSLNPAWIWTRSETHWWLVQKESFAWLPSGIHAPFSQMNGWRVIVIWASPFLAGCAAWMGVTRRRSFETLLGSFIVNAALVALLGGAQRISGTESIFWHFPFQGSFGSFTYRNHAAAFLLLALAGALGLAMRHHLLSLTRLQRSSRAPLYLLLALGLSAGLIMSLSRSGMVAGIILVLGLGVPFGLRLWRARALPKSALTVIAIIAVAVGAGLLALAHRSGATERLGVLKLGGATTDVLVRVLGAEMARAMFFDHPLYGIGAGGYRHLESKYGQKYPSLGNDVRFFFTETIDVRRFRMHDAHNDHLQTLAELGIVGSLLVYGIVATALASLSSARRRTHPLACAQLVALLLLLVLATMDFPFLNPAVLGSLVLTTVIAARWSEVEALDRKA